MAKGGSLQLPTNQIYVIVNSKLSPEFSMPERKINSILGKTIGVALVAGLRAEMVVMTAATQRLGINLSIAQVPDAFTQPNRGLFDHVYMDALFKYGVEQAMTGTAFTSVPMGSVERRSETPQ